MEGEFTVNWWLALSLLDSCACVDIRVSYGLRGNTVAAAADFANRISANRLAWGVTDAAWRQLAPCPIRVPVY